ncbi:hypothetical protein [Clostridium butyricum]|jgi:hypothetical protein|uniref:hypothetical protein n=1 Tax=Clostridium butyricum TaxID=1492 RepID=UPI0015F2B0F5|nr:hypothetical protein [Clostridium butyricum]
MLNSELKTYEFYICKLIERMLQVNMSNIEGTYKSDDNKEFKVEISIKEKSEVEQ